MRMAINQVTNQPNVLVEVSRAFLKRCLALGMNNLLEFVIKGYQVASRHKYQLCVEILDGGKPW